MLTEQRIKIAERNVQHYLEDCLVKKSQNDRNVITIMMINAQESLRMAEHALQEKSYLWTVVCSYYSMFYVANAVLCVSGYRVGYKVAHKVTADALIVFVRHKLKQSLIDEYNESKNEALGLIRADEMLEEFEKEREKRSVFQYSTTELAKESKAKTSFDRAKRFYGELSRLAEL